jgi:branched-chain amino acid transport system permease protein
VSLAVIVAQTAAGGNTAFDRFLVILFRGLAQGSIYAILALGFVLVFKATQTVNFAQGAIALVGTWTFSMILIDWEIPGRWIGARVDENPSISFEEWVVWISAVITGLLFAALLGLIIERLIIRPMIGEPLFSIAVITLGLEAVLRAVGTDAVGINNRSLGIPWGATGFDLGGASIPWSWIATIIAAAISFLAIFLFFRTRTGIAMRAVAFDQEAAMAQGISVGRVFAIAWGAAAALAVVGAICASMSPIGTGTITAASAALAFRALPAVILGGLDSVAGALVGGLTVGLAEVFAGAYLAEYTNTLGTGYQLVVPYIVMLIVLLVRPYGLFGTPEIRRV